MHAKLSWWLVTRQSHSHPGGPIIHYIKNVSFAFASRAMHVHAFINHMCMKWHDAAADEPPTPPRTERPPPPSPAPLSNYIILYINIWLIKRRS